MGNKYRRMTPLITAALRQNGAAVEILLRAGAKTNATTPLGTALHWAAQNENEPILRSLLEQNGLKINAKNGRGTTALMAAASKGNARIVKILLQAGADASLKNSKGKTARELTDNEKCKELIQFQAKK